MKSGNPILLKLHAVVECFCLKNLAEYIAVFTDK